MIKDIDNKIEEIKNRIVKNLNPDKIILFGSYAYGSPDEASDIDLFIVKDTDKRRLDRFLEVRIMLRDIKEVSIQPLIFTNKELEDRLKLKDDFILEILNKGKNIYERK